MLAFLLLSSPETATTSENLNHNSQGAKPATAPECFNGAVLDNYMWSQTGSEVDVRVPVPITVKGKDVLVEIKNNYLKVALKNTQEEGRKTSKMFNSTKLVPRIV